MCQSGDNAKGLIAVWMCPCGGMLRGGEETSGRMYCTCLKCGEHHSISRGKYLYEEPNWDEGFMRVVEPEHSSDSPHPKLVAPTAGPGPFRATPLPEPAEPIEHTTPHGVVYVAQKPVSLG